MKRTIKNNLFYTLLIVAGALLLLNTSCKKPNNNTATGTFYFHLHTYIDTNDIDSGILYRDASGRHFALTVPQFYISGVTLQNANGSTYTIPGAYVLKDLDSEDYYIGTAPVGTYTSVTFNVGVDAAANAIAPSGNTGALANTSMWFGNTTQGYMFMKVQGFADTTTAQNGTGLVTFSYEIGSNANLKTITMPARNGGSAPTDYSPYILTAGSTQYIHIICDYGKLLSVVNFKTQDSTNTYTVNPGLADTIANNIPNMFHYEE